MKTKTYTARLIDLPDLLGRVMVEQGTASERLAKDAGISGRAIRRFVNTKETWPVGTALRIARALGCEVSVTVTLTGRHGQTTSGETEEVQG